MINNAYFSSVISFTLIFSPLPHLYIILSPTLTFLPLTLKLSPLTLTFPPLTLPHQILTSQIRTSNSHVIFSPLTHSQVRISTVPDSDEDSETDCNMSTTTLADIPDIPEDYFSLKRSTPDILQITRRSSSSPPPMSLDVRPSSSEQLTEQEIVLPVDGKSESSMQVDSALIQGTGHAIDDVTRHPKDDSRHPRYDVRHPSDDTDSGVMCQGFSGLFITILGYFGIINKDI